MTIPDRVLRAYLGGALEPGRIDDLEAELETSAALRARLAALSAELSAELSPAQPAPRSTAPAWRLPPPGAMGPWSLRASAAPVAVMGADTPRPGDRVRISVVGLDDPADHLVVVLWRGDGDWEVMLPASERQRVTADRLPVDADGARYLDVTVRPDAPRQRWALALPPADEPIDWAAPERWLDLIARVRDGLVPAVTVAVDVAVGGNG